MKGIPTFHKGRRYRSRMEARWATFFDLLGWKYEYEPFDLNGWIPDFVLMGQNENILVEIKPTMSLDEFPTDKIQSAMAGTDFEQMEVLLLGFTIIEECDDWPDVPGVGWLGEDHGGGLKDYRQAPLSYHNNKWGFIHPIGSFHDRMTGVYEGGHLPGWRPFEEVWELWQRAGNDIQWFPQ